VPYRDGQGWPENIARELGDQGAAPEPNEVRLAKLEAEVQELRLGIGKIKEYVGIPPR